MVMSKLCLRNILRITDIVKNGNGKNGKPSKLSILCDQLIDSAIVGGIAGISSFVASGQKLSPESAIAFAVAFGLTFLIKMKNYRGVAD